MESIIESSGKLVSKALLEPMITGMIDELINNTEDTGIGKNSDGAGTSQVNLDVGSGKNSDHVGTSQVNLDAGSGKNSDHVGTSQVNFSCPPGTPSTTAETANSRLPSRSPNEEPPRGQKRPRDDEDEDLPDPKRSGPTVTNGSNSFSIRGGIRGSNNNFGGVTISKPVAAKKGNGKRYNRTGRQ